MTNPYRTDANALRQNLARRYGGFYAGSEALSPERLDRAEAQVRQLTKLTGISAEEIRKEAASDWLAIDDDPSCLTV